MGGRPRRRCEPAEPSAVRQINARRRSFPTRHGRNQCPTAAPTAAARAGFNRSFEGQRGSGNFNREIPSHCEIRDLDIPDSFYTYCANHPCHRPGRDLVPIGPVYVYRATWPHRGRAGAKSGTPRRTRKRFDDTCSISSANRRSTPMRATTSIRARRTSRPSCSCMNGVMGDSFQRWKRLLGARKRSALAPTSRRP